jgi:hypothetical protein
MTWKIIFIIAGAILFLALTGTIVYNQIKPTESESHRGGVQNYFTFEPHQTFGCARYIAPDKILNDARPKVEVKK